MAGPSVFFLYNLTARAQDIGILSISNPSKEVIALKHFSLPRGLVPLLALALVVSMATPASAFFWQKKENTPAGRCRLFQKHPGRRVRHLFPGGFPVL